VGVKSKRRTGSAEAESGVSGEARRIGFWGLVWRASEGKVGLATMIVAVAVVVVGPIFAPFAPDATGVGMPSSGMSAAHWLGTDQLGRDVLSRVLTGGSPVLLPPMLIVLFAYVVGGGLGIVGPLLGGLADKVISRVFDVLLALPPLLVVLVIVAGVGDSMIVIVVTVGLIFVPRVGRVIRGATQTVVTNEYVAAARSRGESTYAVVMREILPNIAGIAVADGALRLTFGVIFISTLSFLGIGSEPPSSAWGLMVAEGRAIVRVNPWPTIGPSVCIALIAIGSSMLADALGRAATRESNERAIL
jgi:peptide/nickel transport system permease protein